MGPPIVAEIHRVRDGRPERLGYDFPAMCEEQQTSSQQLLTRPPRKPAAQNPA